MSMAVYAMPLVVSSTAGYKCHHRATALMRNEVVAVSNRKPGSTEDWTHLGKLDTSRVLVRTEGAIWNGLTAIGMPALLVEALKWSARVLLLAAVAMYSFYLFVPVLLVCLFLWLVANAGPTTSRPESIGERSSRLASGDVRSVSDLYDRDAYYKDQ